MKTAARCGRVTRLTTARRDERHAHLQGFGAVGQESLDVASCRHHQLLCIVGLHGVVHTVLNVYLKQSEKEKISRT